MPPLKERLGMRIQKVQNMFRPSKRRIAEDDASSQPPKQLRTMLAQTKTSAQDSPYLMPPSTSVPGSSKGNQFASTSPSGDHYPLAYTAMPFIESGDLPGSSRENPIDLDAPPSRSSRSASSFRQTNHSGSGNPIYAGGGESQALNDETIARTLQEEEHEYENQQGSGPEFSGPPTEEEMQDQLGKFKEKYHRWKCHKCQRRQDMTPDTLVKETKSMLKAGMIHPFIKCRKCRYHGCGDCGTRTTVLGRKTDTVVKVNDAIQAFWCCSGGRTFVIFSLLCGYEAPTTTKIPTPPSKGQPPQLPSQQKTTVFAKGTGYGGSHSASPPNQSTKHTPTSEPAEAVSYFLTLAEVLPSVDEEEFVSTPGLRVMINTSPMLRVACEILRSAAIGEMDKRAGIIRAALLFVQRVSRNWDTASCIFHEQILFPPSQQLLMASMSCPKQAMPSNKVKPETAQSAYTVVGNLAVACRVFLDGSKSFAADNDEAICIAVQVYELQQSLDAMKPASEPEPLVSASTTSTVVTRSKSKKLGCIEAAAIMADYHKHHGVMGIEDDVLVANVFSGFKTREVSSTGARMRKLYTQISSLHADLPDGIYVRYGESRPDVLKVLIFGPKSTPYEHGIFLFDMFCDHDFPQSPPKVKFLTTGGGKVRFNPNLYADGKVCLSLLGTWGGPTWVPDVSTILQVLVSIQSMIFVERPYFNEPGYENVSDLTPSEAYDRNVEYNTIHHAIMPWLQAFSQPSSTSPSRNAATPADCKIWGDIALKHFELQGPAILAKVNEWKSKPSAKVKDHMVAVLEKVLNGPLAVPKVSAGVEEADTTSKEPSK
ncbi:putative baculoviral IAP repeat-containing protein [Cercophora samala]|uniref:Baculoviral IAP repeat-containing protein n=1 Tax=Cercophora samala TaxID=330535 RepID=A0AA40D703_9PEZI|nr:putative baculoviral IAP repeat-containing protein [Cercophora samala]